MYKFDRRGGGFQKSFSRTDPRKAKGPNLTLNMYTNLLKIMVMTKLIGGGGARGSKNCYVGRTQICIFLGVALQKG